MGLLPIADEIAQRTAAVHLSAEELRRFTRHVVLPELGLQGQKALVASRVLLVGLGGLGAPSALYLAAAGVGCLALADGDSVDVSNLQRQVLYRTEDVGKAKVAVAARRLEELNPGIKVETHPHMIDPDTIMDLVTQYDLVIDGTDNFGARYLISDACVLAGKPYVYGSISRFSGQASIFYPPYGPCYRCLFPRPPSPGSVLSCAEGGVLGVLPGVIGSIQATEALKLLAGIGEPLLGRLLTYDALSMRWSEFRLTRDKNCALCGEQPTITALRAEAATCERRQITSGDSDIEISLDDYFHLRNAQISHQLVDVREKTEAAICSIDGSLLVPLNDLPKRLSEMAHDRPIVVHCKTGGRSARAVEYMRTQGFTQVWSLQGGILGWSDKYDPTLARY